MKNYLRDYYNSQNLASGFESLSPEYIRNMKGSDEFKAYVDSRKLTKRLVRISWVVCFCLAVAYLFATSPVQKAVVVKPVYYKVSVDEMMLLFENGYYSGSINSKKNKSFSTQVWINDSLEMRKSLEN